jgi:hypothetical protein
MGQPDWVPTPAHTRLGTQACAHMCMDPCYVWECGHGIFTLWPLLAMLGNCDCLTHFLSLLLDLPQACSPGASSQRVFLGQVNKGLGDLREWLK